MSISWNGFVISNCLPTIFAKLLAMGVDLYIDEDDSDEHDDEGRESLAQRLIVFQQIAATADFDTALTAYIGRALLPNQIDALRVIHKSTKPWLMGHAFGALLEKVKTAKPNELPELINTMMENFGEKSAPDAAKQKGLLVRFANIPEGEIVPVQKDEQDDELEE